MVKEDLEKGQVLVIYAVAVVVSLMLVALVFDIGGAFVTYQRAATAVEAAAFAAAQQIDMEEFYTTNNVRIDTGRASSEAGRYALMNANGLSSVQVSVAGDRVLVVGQMQYSSIFGHVLGLSSIHATLTSTAYPAHGITERGQ